MTKRVIVIGAGIADLTTALALSKQHYQVLSLKREIEWEGEFIQNIALQISILASGCMFERSESKYLSGELYD